MDNLPGLQTQPQADADTERYGGAEHCGVLPDVPQRGRPEYRQGPEREAPEPMTPQRGLLLGLAHLFYPEVIARGNKAAKTVPVSRLL